MKETSFMKKKLKNALLEEQRHTIISKDTKIKILC